MSKMIHVGNSFNLMLCVLLLSNFTYPLVAELVQAHYFLALASLTAEIGIGGVRLDASATFRH